MGDDDAGDGLAEGRHDAASTRPPLFLYAWRDIHLSQVAGGRGQPKRGSGEPTTSRPWLAREGVTRTLRLTQASPTWSCSP